MAKSKAAKDTDSPGVRPDGDEPIVLDNDPIRIDLLGFEGSRDPQPKELRRPFKAKRIVLLLEEGNGNFTTRSHMVDGGKDLKVTLETEDGKDKDVLLLGRAGADVVITFKSTGTFAKMGNRFVAGTKLGLRITEIESDQLKIPVKSAGQFYKRVIVVLVP